VTLLATRPASLFRTQPSSAEALPIGHIRPSHRASRRHGGRESRPFPRLTKVGEALRHLLRIPTSEGLRVRLKVQEGPVTRLAAAAGLVPGMIVAGQCPPTSIRIRAHRPCPTSDRRNPWNRTSDHDPAVRACDRACLRIGTPCHKPRPCPLRGSHPNRPSQDSEDVQRPQTPTCFPLVSAQDDDHKPMMRGHRDHRNLSMSLLTVRQLIYLLQSRADPTGCPRLEEMYRQGVSGQAQRRAMRAPTLRAAKTCLQRTLRNGGGRSWSPSHRCYPSVAPPAMGLTLVPSSTRPRGRLHWKFHPEGDRRKFRKDSSHLVWALQT
jgi:hypothetical protein